MKKIIVFIGLLAFSGILVSAPGKRSLSTQFFDVARYGETSIKRVVVDFVSNERDREGFTALMVAVRAGRLNVVNELIALGAEVNVASGPMLNTPLIEATIKGNLEMVEVLLEAGADVNKENRFGFTPLMEAADWGHLGIVKVLLEAGALVDSETDEFKTTALIMAVRSNRIPIIKELVAAGADPDKLDADGKSALIYAKDSDVIAALSKKPSRFEMLRSVFSSGRS
ncbi:MAG TPA: ankyrin repeat domain-containing protein [Candidatus Babeliales bacterium]|nr:ankyrin repeat domain-containing protein [Candidatus Babeliales bacterium]